MVYIRTKKIKGIQYAYLVKSVWDSKASTSRQQTLAYLGKASGVSVDSIPKQYVNNPNIVEFLTSHDVNKQRTEKLVVKLREELLDYLTSGDLTSTLDFYERYVRVSGIADFYDNVLKPVMYKIGDLWFKNKISISTEHIASNIANSLVKIIIDRFSKLPSKQIVLVCTPPGEEHNLGCNVLESFLDCKGFQVFNVSPSAPTESIIDHIGQINPQAILVSITMSENIKSGQRLVKRIKEKYDLPVFVGGFALQNKENFDFDAKVIQNMSLPQIYRAISSL